MVFLSQIVKATSAILNHSEAATFGGNYSAFAFFLPRNFYFFGSALTFSEERRLMLESVAALSLRAGSDGGLHGRCSS